MNSCPRRPSWALLAGVGRDRGHYPLDDRKWKGKEEGLRRHRKERRISKINHNFLTLSRKARAAGLPQICPFYRCKSENAKRVHHFMPLSSVEREMTTPTFIPSESIAILTFNFSDAGCQISSPRKSLRTTKRQRRAEFISSKPFPWSSPSPQEEHGPRVPHVCQTTAFWPLSAVCPLYATKQGS